MLNRPRPSGLRPFRQRLIAALFAFLGGSALAMLLIFAPGELRRWQGLASWQAGTPPLEQLRRHGGVAPQAQAALLAGLYPQGLVASLQASDWAVARHVFDEPPPVQAAALAPDGVRVLTTDTTRVFDWRLPGPGLVAVQGPHRAAAAEAPRETGWGFGAVALTGRGDEAVALATRGRTALWWLGPGARAPWPVVVGTPAQAVDGLAAHEGAVVVWSALGAGLHWLPEGATRALALPHEEVAVARFTAEGTLVSASRTLLQRWLPGQPPELESEQPLSLRYNPLALSDDGAVVMALHDERTLAVLDVPAARTSTSPVPRQGAQASPHPAPHPSHHLAPHPSPRLLPHSEAVSAACACGGLVITGTADGVVRVWPAAAPASTGDSHSAAVPPQAVREWAAYPGRVAMLMCRGDRLLSVGSSGRAEHHALLWDLRGRAQPPEPHVVAPRLWPESWHLRLLLASGLDADASAAFLAPLFDAIEPWAAPLGVGVWTATLLGTGWLLRRRPQRGAMSR